MVYQGSKLYYFKCKMCSFLIYIFIIPDQYKSYSTSDTDWLQFSIFHTDLHLHPTITKTEWTCQIIYPLTPEVVLVVTAGFYCMYNRKSWSEKNSSVGAESVRFGYWLLFGIKMKTRATKYLGENKTEKQLLACNNQ